MYFLNQKTNTLSSMKAVTKLDPVNLDDYFSTYYGMTPTGRTNSFQVAMAPRDRVAVSAQNCLVHVDFFEL